jgi:iron(III) transport system substrate-binding protein
MRVRILLPALLAAAALAACGGSSDEDSGSEGAAPSLDDVLAQVEGLSGEERTQKLVELAGEEGQVSLYTSYSSALADEVAGAFEDAYEISVALYRAEPEIVVQRLLEEQRAGFRGADVVENGGLEMIAAEREGLLQPYDSPSAEGLIEGARHEGWISDSVNTFVLSWNTDLLPAEELPTSWEELADPKWKGKLALDASDVEWYKTLREWLIEEGKTEEEADALLEDIASNAFVVKGHSAAAQLQAAGEFPLFVNFLHVVERFQNEEGAPLDWEPAVVPVVTKTDGVGIVKVPPDPAAALLFMDWLLSDGQEVLAEANVATREDLVAPELGTTLYVDLESLAEEQDEWLRRYDELLANGTPLDTGS